MDVLMKTRMIKLRSHIGKYLVCDENTDEVRQSRNGSTQIAIWVIEPCQKNPDAIRVKSLRTGLYLTASDTPFLLGMTGKRVVQLSIFDPTRVEWEPISDGLKVKFRSSKEGTYLRGNGGTPPWRNSITHDFPLNRGTYAWILWDIEPVSVLDVGSDLDRFLSFGSGLSDDVNGSYSSSPSSVQSSIWSPDLTMKRSGLDVFYNAKTIRLRSHHKKYLIAEEDEESVTQDRNGSTRNTKWVVEFAETGRAIRLKSCYGKYLTTSNQPFLLGMTGLKVTQTQTERPGSSTEWEPVKDGSQIRFKTRPGTYLRANGGLPPWRNSVTHDVPHRTVTKDWVLWDVDVVEILDFDQGRILGSELGRVGSEERNLGRVSLESSSGSLESDRLHGQQLNDSANYSPPKTDGRLIYYYVADDFGNVNESLGGNSFIFTGHSVTELTQKLEVETRLEDIFVCTRSPLDGKLYPLHLQLPPNHATMHIVVVPSTSKLAQDLSIKRI